VADALRKEPGAQVELVDGNKGEFTVLVNGQPVAQKKGDTFPPVNEVVSAAKQAANVAVN
jgi:hypothetical protein